jgi:hypothetical protein
MVNAGSGIGRTPLYHVVGGPSYPYCETGKLKGHSEKKELIGVRAYECEWNWIKCEFPSVVDRASMKRYENGNEWRTQSEG